MSCTSDTACTTCAAGYYEETDANSVDSCLCECLTLHYVSHCFTFHIALRFTLNYVSHYIMLNITLHFTLRYVSLYVMFYNYVTFHT